MPRHTLDKWTYKLKTMDVLLTKHREDDIYNHMVKMYNKAEELFKKYNDKYEAILKEFNDEENHIYARYNWRMGDPSRFWLKNADQWYYVDAPDDQHESIVNEYEFMFKIYSDFLTCDKYSHEWEDEKPEWSSMLYEVTKFRNILKDVADTIKLYEAEDFRKFKARWMVKDREWIEEKDRMKEHKKHNTIELPSTTDTSVIPGPYPDAPLRDDCVYCKQHWEEMKLKYDKCIQIWSKNKQEEDEWKKQQEAEDEAKKRKREMAVKNFVASFEFKEDMECSICNFKANDCYELQDHKESASHKKNCKYCKICDVQCRTDKEYEDHLETIRHKNKEDGIEVEEKKEEDKMKARYCDICQLQCRSDKEFRYHLETTKHKKNAGLVERVKIYKCNHCDYQTTIKCNFEKHVVSKKHQGDS